MLLQRATIAIWGLGGILALATITQCALSNGDQSAADQARPSSGADVARVEQCRSAIRTSLAGQSPRFLSDGGRYAATDSNVVAVVGYVKTNEGPFYTGGERRSYTCTIEHTAGGWNLLHAAAHSAAETN